MFRHGPNSAMLLLCVVLVMPVNLLVCIHDLVDLRGYQGSQNCAIFELDSLLANRCCSNESSSSGRRNVVCSSLLSIFYFLLVIL